MLLGEVDLGQEGRSVVGARQKLQVAQTGAYDGVAEEGLYGVHQLEERDEGIQLGVVHHFLHEERAGGFNNIVEGDGVITVILSKKNNKKRRIFAHCKSFH